jgi:hypothetical protein
MFKVFYSWQSDLPSPTNRTLILNAIQKACAAIKSEGGIAVEPVVDRDTLGLSGAPDISDAILSKIREADAFVADVSLINLVSQEQVNSNPRSILGFGHGLQQRPTPNPNVLIELGYALAHLGNEATVLVVNTHYGPIEQLPFDLRSLRTLTYEASPQQADRTNTKKELTADLTNAIKRIAGVVRADPVHSIAYPLTKTVAGQAEGVLGELIRAAGKPFDAETISEAELIEVCESVDPNGQAPLIIGFDPVQGHQYGTYLSVMCYWRDRSRKFAELSSIVVF